MELRAARYCRGGWALEFGMLHIRGGGVESELLGEAAAMVWSKKSLALFYRGGGKSRGVAHSRAR